MKTTTKVYDATLQDLQQLKKELGLSSKADVIAYLVMHYRRSWTKITKLEERHYKEHIELLRSQLTIKDIP